MHRPPCVGSITPPALAARQPSRTLRPGVLAFPLGRSSRPASAPQGPAGAPSEAEAVARFRMLAENQRRLVVRILRTLTHAEDTDPSDRLFGHADLT